MIYTADAHARMRTTPAALYLLLAMWLSPPAHMPHIALICTPARSRPLTPSITPAAAAWFPYAISICLRSLQPPSGQPEA
mmetsp:Transcript_11948/g.24040  ORF Transcript_11948/g.24040 Transcript_11948/m.24040 type:complete len:80 (-) Transcript_11948:4148-4387(-)